MFPNFPTTRLRRLRQNHKIRSLIQETRLNLDQLIYPIFINENLKIKKAITKLPGLYQYSLNDLLFEIEELNKLNIKNIILFGIPSYKDNLGSASYDENGVIQRAIRIIKKDFPELLIITDLCFCEYTDHGHCGVIDNKHNNYYLDNDKTLELLQKQALSHAAAGSDIVAPSGMIDGMVKTIRDALDQHHFYNTPILSYSVKYRSNLYHPFREAAEGTPQFGDRSSHQLNFANRLEALREIKLDMQEGADLLMVKPAGFYLDIIREIKINYPEIMLGAYQVSGEYAMLKAAVEKDYLLSPDCYLESLLSIKRAGADFIISYFTKELANYFK